MKFADFLLRIMSVEDMLIARIAAGGGAEII